MSKILTIGIGVYGQKRNYIDQTLNSIVALLKKYRFTPKTTIVIYNDDSQFAKDYLTALQFQKKYPNLIICKTNGENLGIAKTYQKMCFQCETPYFMQFDSDDIVADFNIKQQIQFLQNHPQYCGSYGVKRVFKNDGNFCFYFGKKYKSPLFNMPLNNNAMIFRVEDCKNIGFYFPKYVNNVVLKAACDVAMWCGMLLKKPLYFDNTVRTYGRQWQDGNHLIHKDRYNKQYEIIYLLLKKQYNDFNINWTLQQKKIFYLLWKDRLSIQQKKQYWKIVEQLLYKDQILFVQYLTFLYKQNKYQQVITTAFTGVIKNHQLQSAVAKYMLSSKLFKTNLDQLQDIVNVHNDNLTLQNTQWFQKFYVQ